MEKSILKKQIKKIKADPYGRFHMPGHKGKIDNLSCYDLDITEIPGADNLHDAKAIIDRVQEKLATVFGSDQAAILINGSTTGIQAGILAACQPGEELLLSLNCHRSVFAALALGRIKGRFISPSLDKASGLAGEIRLSAIKKACLLYPNVKGMVLVNPTYYGMVSDIQAIADFLHQQGKFLIVDEAHGAQFHFSRAFPKTALESGADLVIQSTHKVLGSLTQSALMHGQGTLIAWSRVKLFLALLQSSSPSYPLMISVEEAVDRSLEKGQEVFEKIKEKHQLVCKNQTGRQVLELYDGSKNPLGYDYSKWLFLSHGISGIAIETMLRDRFGIQCELSNDHSFLAMAGLETSESDIDRLVGAIQSLNSELGERKSKDKRLDGDILSDQMLLELPIWEALWSEKKEKISLKASLNRIAGDFIIPYPPGIPFLLPGALISAEKIKGLEKMIDDGLTIVGIDQKNEFLVMRKEDDEK